ncbi:MAG: branched-chain amino acid ABC transporter permease, partial [Spirochaetota bacterium]
VATMPAAAPRTSSEALAHATMPFGLALLIGFALGGLIGWIVSLFIGDAPTFAVVIVGFTFIYITRTVIENTKAVGGSLGMFGLPNIAATPAGHRTTILLILGAMILIVGFLISRFERTRLGRAASAIFVDKDLAASLGVNIKGMGMLLQTFSCTIAGGLGVIYGFMYKSLYLSFFDFSLVGIAMTVIFVGGYATMWGPLLLAPILYGLPLLFPAAVQSWRIVIYGALLVFVLVLKPEGFITRRFVHGVESFLSGNRRKRNT